MGTFDGSLISKQNPIVIRYSKQDISYDEIKPHHQIILNNEYKTAEVKYSLIHCEIRRPALLEHVVTLANEIQVVTVLIWQRHTGGSTTMVKNLSICLARNEAHRQSILAMARCMCNTLPVKNYAVVQHSRFEIKAFKFNVDATLRHRKNILMQDEGKALVCLQNASGLKHRNQNYTWFQLRGNKNAYLTPKLPTTMRNTFNQRFSTFTPRIKPP
jgi:hypothetical protein